MGKIRGELEDLAFQHLEPDAYKEIVVEIESRRHSQLEEFLLGGDSPDREIRTAPRRHSTRIDGRLKRPYSVFQKLRRQRESLSTRSMT